MVIIIKIHFLMIKEKRVNNHTKVADHKSNIYFHSFLYYYFHLCILRTELFPCKTTAKFSSHHHPY